MGHGGLPQRFLKYFIMVVGVPTTIILILETSGEPPCQLMGHARLELATH